MDYGKQGLIDTKELLDTHSIKHFGSKTDNEGTNVLQLQKDDCRVAIISFSNFEFSIATDHGGSGTFPIDVIDIINGIEALKGRVDHIVLILHTGLYNLALPSPFQRKMCRFFIERGVSAVLCQHSHVCGAFEYYRNGFVSYGQGSFIFDMNKPGSNWEKGYLVNFEISKASFKASVIGVKQFGAVPQVELLGFDEQQEMISGLEKFNTALNDDALYQNYWNTYLEEKRRDYYGSILLPTTKWTRRLVRRINMGKFVSSSLKTVWLNLWRNTEHAEVISAILSKDLNEK